MANVLIGTPCYNGWVSTDYLVSMLGLQRELGRQGIGFSLEMTTTVSLIPVARNFIVSKLLDRQEFTHLLFLDADIGFDPGLVPRYLAANKDIVAGIYPIKNLNLPAIRRLPIERPIAAALDYAVVLCEGEQATSDGFIRAEYAATGFMLIRRAVLEKMAAHYPDLKYHDSFTFVDAPKASNSDSLYALFDTSLDPDTRRYLPEDYTFCHRWRAMGGEIWVDGLSKFAHVGSFVYQGDYSAVVKKSDLCSCGKHAMKLAIAPVCLLLVWIALGGLPTVVAADADSFTRISDVIYGRKFGSALTMDVFTPKEKANGAAVIWVVSGGWTSNRDNINLDFLKELLSRGYTVFAVMHGSQPKYTIPEAIADMTLSVRYIRAHAADFKIKADRIGVSGGSAGGHLSLMLGTTGDAGDPQAKDPVARTSSRVQAVACFFPPTDFLNYGTPGFAWLNRGPKDALQAPFDFHGWNPETKRFEVVDEATRVKIAREISPVYHVTPDDPPTLIIHGDKDALVPLQQSQLMIAKFKEVGVACELVVKSGEAHGWKNWHDDMRTIADWFDKYLARK